MKKRILTVAMFILFLNALKAQNNIENDSTNYKTRKLTIDEVNIATSYYTQDGNNSAVTGGIGTEKLHDNATTIDLTLSKYDRYYNKHSLNLECGVDVYTSASSDKINPATVSSASSSDLRVYPSFNYKYSDNQKKYSLGAGASFSSEFDYISKGVNVVASKSSKDNNRAISAKLSAFFDTWKVIYPIEVPRSLVRSFPSDEPRNSYNLGLVFSQVINREFQLALLADISYQKGLLGTRFNRVYFNDGTLMPENLPDKRFKLPLGIRASYFLGDNIVLRGFYRYYSDNWDIKAHTASLEATYKITPFVSLSPSYRYYVQSAAKNFAPYKQHNAGEEFYTSDYDLSKFHSNMLGLNARFSALNDKIGFGFLNTIELRYGYYNRSTGLKSHIVTLVLTFKK
jgi:hypothetical protein